MFPIRVEVVFWIGAMERPSQFSQCTFVEGERSGSVGRYDFD
jgi:hypothetical protein